MSEQQHNKMCYSVAEIEGKLIFLHEAVWCFYNGLIPVGFLIFHKDGNVNNNNIENLELVKENDEHGDLHLKENKIFHSDTYDEEFVKKHFEDIYERLKE